MSKRRRSRRLNTSSPLGTILGGIIFLVIAAGAISPSALHELNLSFASAFFEQHAVALSAAVVVFGIFIALLISSLTPRRRVAFEFGAPTESALAARRLYRLAQLRLYGLGLFCFAVTASLFGVIYLAFKGQVMTTIYQQVLDSYGTLTYIDVSTDRVVIFGSIAALVYLVLCTVEFSLLSRRIFGRGVNLPVEVVEQQRQLEPSRRFIHNSFEKLTPEGFERRVAALIRQQTGYAAEVVGGSGDRGADILVYDNNRRLRGIVQCKRYERGKALSPDHVRALVAVKQDFRVNIAYLATTTHFSRQTRAYAIEHDVRLIDGDDLKRIVNDVSRQQQAVGAPTVPAREPVYEDEHARVQAQLYERAERLKAQSKR